MAQLLVMNNSAISGSRPRRSATDRPPSLRPRTRMSLARGSSTRGPARCYSCGTNGVVLVGEPAHGLLQHSRRFLDSGRGQQGLRKADRRSVEGLRGRPAPRTSRWPAAGTARRPPGRGRPLPDQQPGPRCAPVRADRTSPSAPAPGTRVPSRWHAATGLVRWRLGVRLAPARPRPRPPARPEQRDDASR